MTKLPALTAVSALLLTACGGAQLIDRSPRRCLLLTTNDSESNFDGPRAGTLERPSWPGTIARIAAEKQRLLAQRPGAVLLVEGGDVLQGRYMERQDGDRPLAMQRAWQVYEAAGYDYAAIGNHEFDAGPKALRVAMLGLSRLRLLSANLRAEGTALEPREPGHPRGLFGATAIVACGGIRVGLLGLTTPSTRTISQLGDVRFDPDPVKGPARAAAAALRSEGADVVVALSHLGLEQDLDLAEDVTGLDAVIGGHSHSQTTAAKRVRSSWVTQSGSRFSHLGYLELTFEGSPPAQHLQVSWQLRPVTELQAIDENLQTRIANVRASLVQEVLIGIRQQAWDLRDPRGPYSVLATRAVWQRARQADPHVVAALLNVGGFRSDTLYPPGPVTNLEVKAIHPFDNRLVLVTLTGQQLLDTLEHSCIPGSDGHGQGLVLWGVSGHCDRDRPPPTYRYADGRPVEILGHGQRVVDPRLGEAPLDPAGRYTVATIDYLAKGGSGYLPLSQGERRCVDGAPLGPSPCPGPLMAELIADAVRAGTLETPEAAVTLPIR